MVETTAGRSFNTRAFIAVMLFASGAILPVSGIMNHQLQMETMNTARHFWMAVHNMSAILFTVASITHCVFNWKPMIRHIRNAGRAVLTREAGAALVLVLAVVGLFAGHALRVR